MATGGFRLLSVGVGFLVSDCIAVQKSMTCLSSGGKVQARKSMPVSSPRRLMAGFIVRITCASSILSRSSILSVVQTILKRIFGLDFLWQVL